ncbi:MAG: tetratricopeptide repeat protein [Bacteroidetes bacterium]|nr:tetratricopeptide repeat protein [Bacteroidota bacterium]
MKYGLYVLIFLIGIQSYAGAEERKGREIRDTISVYFNAGLKFENTYPDSALHFYDLCLFKIQKEKDEAEIPPDSLTAWHAKVLRRKGIMLYYLNKYPEAMESFREALTMYTGVADKKGISACNTNLGNVHSDLENFDLSLDYYTQAMEIDSTLDDVRGIASGLINIGNVWLLRGMSGKDNLTVSAQYSTASGYFEKALGIFLSLRTENPDEKSSGGISDCYNNLAIIYKRQGQYDRALGYYEKSLESDRERGDRKGEAAVLINMAALCYETGAHRKCIAYAEKSNDIAEGAGLLDEQKRSWEIMTYAWYELKEIGRAFDAYVKCTDLKDSIFDLEKDRHIAEMEARFQNEKKQLEIENLTKEKALQKAELERNREELMKHRILTYSFICGFIIILVFSVIVYRLFIAKKMANVQLAEQNEEIRAQKEEIESQAEKLADAYEDMKAQKDLISDQNREITSSIQYAKRIQNALLPAPEVFEGAGLEYFIIFKPRDIVSGDFYWAARKSDRLYFAVADCTGHGVPGALMSMLGISFLNEILNRHHIESPGKILDILRKLIVLSLKQQGGMKESAAFETVYPDDIPDHESAQHAFTRVKDGMDIALCALNLVTRELQYAGANNPLYLVNAQGLVYLHNTPDPPTVITEIKADNMPVSIHRRMESFKNHAIEMTPGDRIYIFTDGYADQFGGQEGKKLKYGGFRQIILETCNLPVPEQKESLEQRLAEWMAWSDETTGNPYEQVDDITVLGIKI